jgi:hypothetical protein
MSVVAALPGRVTLQRAGPDSVPLIASLVNAHSLNLVGTRRALIDADGGLRLAHYMPDSAEAYIGHVGRAAPSGFFYLVAQPPHVVAELGSTLLPAFTQAAPAALTWLEGRARGLAAGATSGESSPTVTATASPGRTGSTRALGLFPIALRTCTKRSCGRGGSGG